MTSKMCCGHCTSNHSFSRPWKVCGGPQVLRKWVTQYALDTVSATPPLRHSQFAGACVRNANKHHDYITQTKNSVHYQHESARIATSSLDAHVLVILDTFDSISVNSRRELDKQATLLAGLGADLELISQVRIHVEFMSNAVRKAIEAGEKHRTLGDYVSSAKMKTVAEACRRTHGM